MKTNFLKKALPIGVGMMAVAFAFATENKSSQNNEEVLMTGYIYNAVTDHCDEVQVDCNLTSEKPCTIGEIGNEQDVFAIRNSNETRCSTLLFKD